MSFDHSFNVERMIRERRERLRKKRKKERRERIAKANKSIEDFFVFPTSIF